MTVSWFVTFRRPGSRVTDSDMRHAAEILTALGGVEAALLFTPAGAHDPYLNDGAPPPLAIQVKFTAIEALEAASRGPVAGLAALPSLAGAEIGEQAMLTRVFPVPDPSIADAPRCTYLVAYEGEAEDMNAWLSHYIGHHPPIMARFPGIREIEIYSRLDWCSATGWRRENAMQRNKVVFDSPEALTAALNSPVRHEMREDFARFPPFSGGNTHFPMWTVRVV